MKKSIRFEYEAHYIVSKDPDFKEEEIWLLFHGYGQLSEFFIRKFQPYFSENRLFIAPEATNYAYLKDFQGRVGANWMTRHEREKAIENNHRYLDELMGLYLSKFERKPKIRILGFSQGAATATRWASRWSGEVDTLILWAGGFAHDMKLEDAKGKFFQTDLKMVLGTQDELITPESIDKQEELIRSLGKAVEKITFEGGHELDAEILKRMMEVK